MKFPKLLLVLIGGILILTIMAYLILNFVTSSNKSTGSFPENGEVISEKYNICLHSEPNSGSGDWTNIFSYYCDTEVRWDEINQLDYEKNGVLDTESKLSCEKAYLIDEGNPESKVLHFDRISWCANLFNDKRSSDRRVIVDEKGKFTVLTF